MTTDRTIRQERNAAIAIAAVNAANGKLEEPEPRQVRYAESKHDRTMPEGDDSESHG